MAKLSLLILAALFCSTQAFLKLFYCKKPSKPANGDFGPSKLFGLYRPGSKIWFSCNRGYELKGTKDLKCVRNGLFKVKWSASFPTCVSNVRCPNIPYVTNGYVKGKTSKNHPGEKVWFFCNKGYILDGVKDLSCGYDGKWSAKFPTCRGLTCTEPIAPENGSFGSFIDHYGVGTTVWFDCDEGFRLIGQRDVTCTKKPKGAVSWSHEFPVCEEEILCDNLGEIENGSFEPDNDIYVDGEEVVYQCDEGYGMVGGSVLQCQADGTFNDTKPVCVPIECAEPWIANGNIRKKRDVYRPGANIWFYCNIGYELSGFNDLECLTNGQWNKGFPTCESTTECASPRISNGYVEGKTSSYEPGAKIWFHCNRGYKLSGFKDLECLDSGEWNNNFPTCKKFQIANGGCRAPPRIDNGAVVRIRSRHDQAWYRCHRGYVLIGAEKITCRDGHWVNPGQICAPNNSCRHRCGLKHEDARCQCDGYCSYYGNCCYDKAWTCRGQH